MSVAVLSAFMEESQAELASRLVGIVLSDAAGDDGICWLAQSTIARRARIDERHVRRCIANLVELGEVEVRKAQRGRSRVNVYRMRLGASVPQYERLPFDLNDPFADHRTNEPVVARDHRTFPAVTTGHFLPNPAPTPLVVKSNKNRKGERPRDELWEALVAEIREPTTGTERKRFNAALKELRDAGATPDDIRKRCRAYRREWPTVELTPHALVANWSRFAPKRKTPVVEAGPPGMSDAEVAENRRRVLELMKPIGREVA